MGCRVWVCDVLGLRVGGYIGVVECECMRGSGLGLPVGIYLGLSVFLLAWWGAYPDLMGRVLALPRVRWWGVYPGLMGSALALPRVRRPGGCGRRRCRWWK